MSNATVHARLRRDVALTAAALALVLVAGVVGVAGLTDRFVAIRWGVVAAGVVAFELWFLRRNLDTNHAETDGSAVDADDRYDGLGLPNAVTLIRGGLFAGVAGFVAVDPTPSLSWVPALLYGAGCAIDGADGVLARRRGRTTLLGARLDLAFDTLGFLVAPLVAVLWGRLPVWYLSLSAARYLFKAGRGLRRRREQPVYDLPSSRVRRPLAGGQMAFITLALAPILPRRVVVPLAFVVLLPSLAVFVRDYLVVSGRLDTGH